MIFDMAIKYVNKHKVTMEELRQFAEEILCIKDSEGNYHILHFRGSWESVGSKITIGILFGPKIHIDSVILKKPKTFEDALSFAKANFKPHIPKFFQNPKPILPMGKNNGIDQEHLKNMSELYTSGEAGVDPGSIQAFSKDIFCVNDSRGEFDIHFPILKYSDKSIGISKNGGSEMENMTAFIRPIFKISTIQTVYAFGTGATVFTSKNSGDFSKVFAFAKSHIIPNGNDWFKEPRQI